MNKNIHIITTEDNHSHISTVQFLIKLSLTQCLDLVKEILENENNTCAHSDNKLSIKYCNEKLYVDVKGIDLETNLTLLNCTFTPQTTDMEDVSKLVLSLITMQLESHFLKNDY